MVTWRGVGCGVRWPEGGVERVWVGSVAERTRVEKKRKKNTTYHHGWCWRGRYWHACYGRGWGLQTKHISIEKKKENLPPNARCGKSVSGEEQRAECESKLTHGQ